MAPYLTGCRAKPFRRGSDGSRRTRPIVRFVNVADADPIIYAIFNGLNENPEWKEHTHRLLTRAA